MSPWSRAPGSQQMSYIPFERIKLGNEISTEKLCLSLLGLLISQGVPLLSDLPQGDDEAHQPPDHQSQEKAQTRDINISLQVEKS